jgi:hypothetical protein
MKIKSINKFLNAILGKNVIGVTLCPFGIYVKNLNDKITINHEKIHWKQQIEMLVIPFYIWYVLEYIIKIFSTKEEAYNALSFEREASEFENDFEYLNNRKCYAWLKYLFHK